LGCQQEEGRPKRASKNVNYLALSRFAGRLHDDDDDTTPTAPSKSPTVDIG